jgi:hypothetical protein
MTVPARSSRLRSHAQTEGCEAASGSHDALAWPCFRYQLIPTEGAAASLSAGTIHAPSSLNGSSHPAISLEWVEASKLSSPD